MATNPWPTRLQKLQAGQNTLNTLLDNIDNLPPSVVGDLYNTLRMAQTQLGQVITFVQGKVNG